MSRIKVFITGLGVTSPVGSGVESIRRAIQSTHHRFAPLSLFEAGQDGPLPTGQVSGLDLPADIPRTHALALAAAREAMGDRPRPPDAVVLGGTTGGIPETETLLLAGERDPARFSLHATGSVAELVARELGCAGPALTISTACSSSAVALAVALGMLRTGRYCRVLAGGADGLCRLTYYGFGLLQLIDPQGARPLDQDRAGMTVSEGAAMLLLEASDRPPPGSRGRLLGCGLSCDAHHPTAPHPQGTGALEAMRAALDDAGVGPDEVDYVNLHGTGTRDNDASEARAVRALFGKDLPPHSSTKGIFGHTLAAAGAIEAIVSTVAVEDGLLPPNAGCRRPDPELDLSPVLRPGRAELRTVVSNSFGFGGNNAAVVIGRPDDERPGFRLAPARRFSVLAAECLTGAGFTAATLERISAGRKCAGILDPAEVVRDLPPGSLRRIKRLPRIALALGRAACSAAPAVPVRQVFFGTGFGPMSETCDFLTRLFENEKRLSSPTDFVGSVHNAPAGQLAMRHKATGANVTATGGDTSFEQALLMASVLARPGDSGLLLLGADEHHRTLGPLFDPSVAAGRTPADGGGALLLSANEVARKPRLGISFFERAGDRPGLVDGLIEALGGPARIRERFGAVMAGLPAAHRDRARPLLDAFMARIGIERGPIDFRPLLGEYAAVSASACALAVRLVETGVIPGALIGDADLRLSGRGILLLSFGASLAAVEVLP